MVMKVLTGRELIQCVHRIMAAGLVKDLGRLGYDDQAVATSLISRGWNAKPVIEDIIVDPEGG